LGDLDSKRLVRDAYTFAAQLIKRARK